MSGLASPGAVPLESFSPSTGGRSLSSNGGPHGDVRPGPYPMGLMAILATVAMLFAAFTAALLVRRTGADWTPVELPVIVWINAVVIVASSVLVEFSKRALRDGDGAHAPVWLTMGSVFGVFFLVGQLVAWRALIAQGVLLPTSPHAAFFYMLSAVHGAHVLGGLGALTWTLNRAFKGAYTASSHAGLDHAAIYWHFVGTVWIYLLILLSVV
jgi:cytochrome c oxidase subunit 3